MSWTVVYLVLSLLCLSCGSVATASGLVQITDIKVYVLEKGDNNYWQCALIEERERARNEIHQLAMSVVSSTYNGTPGWRCVAFVNMTDTSYNCPTGLNITSYSKRTCGRSHAGGGCSSTIFSVGGLPYSHVCGRIRGYQFGSTDVFWSYTRGIDSYYIDGISLTCGHAGSRQHIWTFAAGLSEVNNNTYLKGTVSGYKRIFSNGSRMRIPNF